MPLPLELVLKVIEALRPKYSNVLLPQSHPITQTLLSFTLVCHATRRVANRCLLQHCVYLNSESRIRSFSSDIYNRQELRTTEAISLQPFELELETEQSITVSREILDILTVNRLSLKRLVIALPNFYGYSNRGDQELRDIEKGIALLENLEELVSLGRDFYTRIQPDSWAVWPKLRRLVLSDPHNIPAFWAQIARLPRLETVVFVPAYHCNYRNVKAMYFAETDRPIKIILVSTAQLQIQHSQFFGRRMWDRIDPEKKMTIMTYDVPMVFQSDSNRPFVTDYVRAGAENGTLWDWEGEIVPHPPVFPPRAIAPAPATSPPA